MLDLAFRPDPTSDEPVYRQLAGYLESLVSASRLRPGERVPPTRDLARALGVGRNTVTRAYEALASLGVLDAHVGRGTFVQPRPRRGHPAGGPREEVPAAGLAWPGLLARRARAMQQDARRLALSATSLAGPGALEPERLRIDLRPGQVDPAALPLADLQRAWQRALGRLRARANEVDPLGDAALRAAIARRLAARGIACRADEVLVVAGAQQALDLVARVLVDPGDAVAVEQPGYFGAALAFQACEAHLVGVGVDAEGLRVAELARVLRTRRVKLVYATPAVQLPTGVALSGARREALLELAEREQVPVLEDDYDSELRWVGPAAPALKTLDAGGRVIYVGTFSKALFPGLRIGYVVAPPALLRALAVARLAACFQPSLVDQLALADLLEGDTVERHVRRVRRGHAERARALLGALAAHMPPGARWREPGGGSALWLLLPPAADADALARQALARGVALQTGAGFFLGGGAPPALLLSFAAAAPEALAEGAAEIAALLRRQRPPREAPRRTA